MCGPMDGKHPRQFEQRQPLITGPPKIEVTVTDKNQTGSGSVDIPCDRCDRTITMPAGQDRIECPHCGDMNRISRSSAAANHAEEKILLLTRPALVRGHPLSATLGGIGLLGGLLIALLSWASSEWPDWLVWPGQNISNSCSSI